MSRKAVLNVTSTKKRDVMIGGTTFPPLIGNVGALTVTADIPAVVLWNASARNLADTPTSAFTMAGTNQRTRSDVFFVGAKEKISIRTNTSAAWRWRRIVFTHKGLLPGFEFDDLARTFFQVTTASGLVEMQRPVVALPFPLTASLYEYVFRGFGVNNVSAPPRDWVDPMTAPVDTTRILVMSDMVKTINSGNDAGIVRTFNMWHPVRKNINYADNENGGEMTSSPLSTTSRLGIGDIYVMDLITGNTEDAGDILDWLPTSTVYWHEK